MDNLTNGDLYDLAEEIAEKVGALWPTLESALKPYENELWFVGIKAKVDLWRDYR